jgi:hypothetical protein
MSDAGPALTLLGWLRPGINGLGWNSIHTACNCCKSAACHFAESHRARKHSRAGMRNLMKSSALKCSSISRIRNHFCKRSRESFARGRSSRCRTSRSFPTSGIGKLCPGTCRRATIRISLPAPVCVSFSLPFLARGGFLLHRTSAADAGWIALHARPVCGGG